MLAQEIVDLILALPLKVVREKILNQDNNLTPKYIFTCLDDNYKGFKVEIETAPFMIQVVYSRLVKYHVEHNIIDMSNPLTPEEADKDNIMDQFQPPHYGFETVSTTSLARKFVKKDNGGSIDLNIKDGKYKYTFRNAIGREVIFDSLKPIVKKDAELIMEGLGIWYPKNEQNNRTTY